MKINPLKTIYAAGLDEFRNYIFQQADKYSVEVKVPYEWDGQKLEEEEFVITLATLKAILGLK